MLNIRCQFVLCLFTVNICINNANSESCCLDNNSYINEITDKKSVENAKTKKDKQSLKSSALISTCFAAGCTAYVIYKFLQNKESLNKESLNKESIIKDNRYLRTKVHIDGIPDGICYEVTTAIQSGGTCGRCAFAYLLQQYLGLSDTFTRKHRESNEYFERFKNDCRLSEVIEKNGFDCIFAFPETLCYIFKEYFDNKIVFLNTGIDIYRIWSKTEAGSKAAFLNSLVTNYFVFNRNGNVVHSNLKNEDIINNLERSMKYYFGGLSIGSSINQKMPTYIGSIYQKVFDNYRNNTSTLILLAPVTGEWVAHALAFEIEPNLENSKFPFKIICYDSLPRYYWRDAGALFIYEFLIDRSDSDAYSTDVKNALTNWLLH